MTNTTNKSAQPFYFKVVLGSCFVIIVLMLFALARSTYRDLFQVGSYIETSTTFIDKQKKVLEKQPAELAYVSSPRYREKIAKEVFGKRLPGEEVIILTNETQNFEDFLPKGIYSRKKYELLTPPQKWLRYLFGV